MGCLMLLIGSSEIYFHRLDWFELSRLLDFSSWKIDCDPDVKVKENKTNDDIYKVKYVKPSSTSYNVQTGVSSLSGIIATLSASIGGLVVSKKRKNK